MTKTVLILGAGASRPYGLPTSDELRKLIIGADDAEPIIQELVPPSRYAQFREKIRGEPMPQMYERNRLYARPLLDEVFGKQGLNDSEIADFRNTFFDSQRVSIDAFVQRFPKYRFPAQIAAATFILLCERNERLDCDWYQYLLEALLRPGWNLQPGQLGVVTFNYDRSFERFFLRALAPYYEGNRAKAREAFEMIEIVHVYGHIGPIPEQNQPREVPYGHFKVLDLAEQLRMADGRAKPSDELKRARGMVKDANKVIFLGFGFWKENIEALELVTADDPSMNAQQRQACGFGLPRALSDDLFGKYGIYCGDARHKCLEYLRHEGAFSF